MLIQATVRDRDGPYSDAENREIAQLVLRGIRLLCGWTSDVVETISWKLMHPTDHIVNPKCPSSAEEYERAIRYNLSPAEKTAFVEARFLLRLLFFLSCLPNSFWEAFG